jgi:hypothetical protein
MGKFPFKRPRIISKKFPEIDSSIDGVTKSLNDLVFAYRENVNKALSKKHWMMAFSSIAVLLVLGSFISQKGKAESSVFYPDSCLGGWINPHNAQGEPETTSNGDESQFTKQNSAVLPKNTNAEMYCGNFKGKFDAATRPTKIIVSLALTKGADLSPGDMLESKYIATTSPNSLDVSSTSKLLIEASSSQVSKPLVEASSSPTLNPLIKVSSSTDTYATSSVSSSTDTVIATPGGTKNTGPSVVDSIVKSVQDAIHDIFGSTNTDTTRTDTVVVPPPVPVDSTSSTPVNNQQNPTGASSSTPPTSYLPFRNSIFSQMFETVFAQENTSAPVASSTEVIPPKSSIGASTTQMTKDQSPRQEVATTTEITYQEHEQKATSSINAIPNTGSSTLTSTTSATDTSIIPTSDPSSGTSSDPVNTTKDSNQFQNNFLEVFYTFDGVTWTSLGELNEISMKYRTFEIPVLATTSWNEMSQLQIKIVAKKLNEDNPTVYLDGIKVEVLYETTIPHDHPDFARDTILKDVTDGSTRVVNIINSDVSASEIWYTTIGEQGSTGVAPGTWVRIDNEQLATSHTLVDIKDENVFWIDNDQKLLWVTNLEKATNNGIGVLQGSVITTELATTTSHTKVVDGVDVLYDVTSTSTIKTVVPAENTTVTYMKNNGEEWIFEYNATTKYTNTKINK